MKEWRVVGVAFQGMSSVMHESTRCYINSLISENRFWDGDLWGPVSMPYYPRPCLLSFILNIFNQSLHTIVNHGVFYMTYIVSCLLHTTPIWFHTQVDFCLEEWKEDTFMHCPFTGNLKPHLILNGEWYKMFIDKASSTAAYLDQQPILIKQLLHYLDS